MLSPLLTASQRKTKPCNSEASDKDMLSPNSFKEITMVSVVQLTDTSFLFPFLYLIDNTLGDVTWLVSIIVKPHCVRAGSCVVFQVFHIVVRAREWWTGVGIALLYTVWRLLKRDNKKSFTIPLGKKDTKLKKQHVWNVNVIMQLTVFLWFPDATKLSLTAYERAALWYRTGGTAYICECSA